MNGAEDLEQGILGSFILQSDAIPEFAGQLTARDFYDDRNRAVFTALIDAHESEGKMDLRLFTDYLLKNDLMEKAGGPLYVSDLASQYACIPSLMEKYIRRVQEESDKRTLRDIGHTLVSDSDRMEVSVEEVYTRMSESLTALTSQRPAEGATRASDVIAEVDRDLRQAMEMKKSFGGLDTGFDVLNTTLNGFCGSELTVIGARPSVGKTTLALQFGRQAAFHGKVPVGIFSLEMSRKQILQRLLCMQAGINVSRLRRGVLEPWEVDEYEIACDAVREWPIYIDDTPALTIPQMTARMLKMKRAYDIKLWIVDYLQLMTGEGESENQQVNSVSKGLKGLSKVHDEPVVVLSQLNRSVEARSDKKPQLADMRGSGGIEQDADSCLLLYRPGFYPYLRSNWKGKHDINTYAELIAEKTRFGPTGIIPLQWVPERAEFKNG